MSDLHDVQFGITSMTVKRGYPMRAPTERDQCQAKLDILVEGFMGDDWDAYRGAFAWLRDFANLKNTERGRVTKVSLAHRAQKGSRDRLARKASRAIKARLARPVRTVKK